MRSVLEPSSNSGAPSGITLTVDLSQRRQAVTSFGGAFNEQGWQALAALNPVDREAALRALFDREIGLGFDYCRVPIGASDYAIDRYTLDESPADYQMAHFSIERDQQRLIPYLKAARRVRPDLKFWASAWTPPTWMKTPATFDGGAFKDDPAIYGAYALYLARFVESYAEQGLPISMVVPQNEPQTLTHYPSCDWTPAQYVKFLRDYAGPLFKQRGLNTQLFVGTINFESWDLSSVLRAPGVAQYVSGVAIQWGGIAHAADIRASWPELPIMQSETECGNNPGEPGFNPDHAANDFSYAAHTWRKLRDFFRAGASSYMLWNMVLDEQGKNLDSPRPWPQNSAIVVDRRNKRVIYTPMFWATKHFSRLVARGGRLVRSDSAYEDQVVFLNPDGTVVVELSNTSNAIVSLNVAVDGYSRAITLPPRSFASLLLPPA
ncbi:MAG: glycoside hydrolase family 30 beta sandwich domain-containing protein [Pseudomonadota bacterium]